MLRREELELLIRVPFLKGVHVVWIIVCPLWFWRLQVGIIVVQFLNHLGAAEFHWLARTQHAQGFDVVQIFLLVQDLPQSRERHDRELSVEFTGPFQEWVRLVNFVEDLGVPEGPPVAGNVKMLALLLERTGPRGSAILFLDDLHV